jgi:glycosyltransferase involved in cell wall biosynthesis
MIRKIRLLFVAGWLWPWSAGGPSNVLKNVIDRLSLNPNFEITVYATIPWNERKNVYRYYPNNVKFYLSPTFWAADGFFDTTFAQIIYVLQTLKAENFDIVHFNILPGLRAGILPWIMQKLKRSKAAFILNFHDFPQIEAHLMSDSGLKTLGTLIHWSIAQAMISKFDVVVVNSTFIQNLIEEQGFFKNNIRVIPNGINSEEFNSIGETDKFRNSFNLVCFGTFSPKKAQDILITAFNNTSSKDYSHLYLVGKENNFRKICEKLCEGLNLSQKVSFLKPLKRDDLVKLLLSSDIYVQPSLWEGFGIAMLEAMACGKPVITTFVGGQNDFISDGLNGLLVPPSDTDSLAEAIDKLASNQMLRKTMGQNARKISFEYDWKRIIMMYETLYDDML